MTVNAAAVVITERPGVSDARGLAGREADALVLTAEERRWGRRRAITRGGREVVLALPTGTVMAPGDVLYVAEDWYLRVEAALEAVLAVTGGSREEELRVVFEVGNRHFSVAAENGRLLVPDDPAMVDLLTRLGVAFERTRAVFAPLGRGHRHD